MPQLWQFLHLLCYFNRLIFSCTIAKSKACSLSADAFRLGGDRSLCICSCAMFIDPPYPLFSAQKVLCCVTVMAGRRKKKYSRWQERSIWCKEESISWEQEEDWKLGVGTNCILVNRLGRERWGRQSKDALIIEIVVII